MANQSQNISDSESFEYSETSEEDDETYETDEMDPESKAIVPLTQEQLRKKKEEFESVFKYYKEAVAQRTNIQNITNVRNKTVRNIYVQNASIANGVVADRGKECPKCREIIQKNFNRHLASCKQNVLVKHVCPHFAKGFSTKRSLDVHQARCKNKK